jgi:hypothetical protein
MGGAIISESGGGFIPLQGGGIIQELGAASSGISTQDIQGGRRARDNARPVSHCGVVGGTSLQGGKRPYKGRLWKDRTLSQGGRSGASSK